MDEISELQTDDIVSGDFFRFACCDCSLIQRIYAEVDGALVRCETTEDETGLTNHKEIKVVSGECFYMACPVCFLTHRIRVEIDGNLVKLGITRDEEKTGVNRLNLKELVSKL